MHFQPNHYQEKLKIINPIGTLGVVTLWSRVDTVIDKLSSAGVNIGSDSNIAVVGNLYGEGFRYLLRNLLYNPQIDSLLILGKDSSESSKLIINFFEYSLEKVEHDIKYNSSEIERTIEAVRVIGTNHVMDDLVKPEDFQNKPEITHIDGIDSSAILKAVEFINSYSSKKQIGERQNIEVPEVKLLNYPSNVRSHTIIEDTPSKAWRYLVHRIFRFGDKVSIAKGKRRELQNVKVVIEKPQFEDDETIRRCGFAPELFKEYQKNMLSGDLPSDKEYTYGHRIISFFGVDCLSLTANILEKGLDDRNCYFTTWNNKTDITGNSRPCLVSLFFRKNKNNLYLTAIFRTHNASNAWYENVYGLMAYQNYICEQTGLTPSALTVFSQSISLDPAYLENAKVIHDEIAKINTERRDPNGHFTIKTEGSEIVVEHWSGSTIINEYRAKKPEKIQNMLYRDCAISDINHAMNIGMELGKAYQCIRLEKPYIQDRW
jgi:thymidylate synthase